jgi:hypothetical protein
MPADTRRTARMRRSLRGPPRETPGARAAVRGAADCRVLCLLHLHRRHRQVSEPALSGAAAGVGALGRATAADARVAWAEAALEAPAHEAAADAAHSRRGADRVVGVFFFRAQVPAARRNDRAQLHLADPGHAHGRLVPGRGPNAPTLGVCRRRLRGRAADRASGQRGAAPRGAVRSRCGRALCGIPDSDAQARRRGSDGAHDLPQPRRHGHHVGGGAVVPLQRMVSDVRSRPVHRYRHHGLPRAPAVHPRVPAGDGVGDRTVHLRTARLVDARRLAGVRHIPRRVDAGRDRRHRRQRCGTDLVRALAQVD